MQLQLLEHDIGCEAQQSGKLKSCQIFSYGQNFHKKHSTSFQNVCSIPSFSFWKKTLSKHSVGNDSIGDNQLWWLKRSSSLYLLKNNDYSLFENANRSSSTKFAAIGNFASNRDLSFFFTQRLVVCLEESLYIHNIRDMKVLHTIRDTPPNVSGLCILSAHSISYVAYPGSNTIGEVQIFDAINFVSIFWPPWNFRPNNN